MLNKSMGTNVVSRKFLRSVESRDEKRLASAAFIHLFEEADPG